MELTQVTNNELNIILSNFDVNTSKYSYERINTGYINDSYYIIENGERKYVLQKINTNVFQKIDELKNNINLSISKLKDINYHKIKFIDPINQELFYNSGKEYWRLMEYVKGSYTKDNAENTNDAFEAGRILSLFHILLKDEDLEKYLYTLDNFHNLPHRIKEFEESLDNSDSNLKEECKEEINFSIEMFDRLIVFYNSSLPERICHNDSKLIMFNVDIPIFDGLEIIKTDSINKIYKNLFACEYFINFDCYDEAFYNVLVAIKSNTFCIINNNFQNNDNISDNPWIIINDKPPSYDNLFSEVSRENLLENMEKFIKDFDIKKSTQKWIDQFI